MIPRLRRRDTRQSDRIAVLEAAIDQWIAANDEVMAWFKSDNADAIDGYTLYRKLDAAQQRLRAVR